MSDAHGVARDQLRAFIERIERLEEEKKTIADDIKDVYGEAKGMGYDTVIMKRVIALRKKGDQERMEEGLILDTYLAALGMIEAPFDQDDEPVSAAPVRSPAKPLQAPRTATTISARVAINQPETAPKMQHPGSHLIGNPEPALAAANRPKGDDGMVRMARTEASAVTAGETATNSQIAPASHGEAEASSVESVRLLNESSIDANPGGDHVTASANAQPDQDGPGLVSAPRPSKHPILLLRPHCQHPGEEVCGGSGKNHCQKCLAAMREVEIA